LQRGTAGKLGDQNAFSEFWKTQEAKGRLGASESYMPDN